MPLAIADERDFLEIQVFLQNQEGIRADALRYPQFLQPFTLKAYRGKTQPALGFQLGGIACRQCGRAGNLEAIAPMIGSRTGFGGNYLTILMRDGAAGRSLKTEDGAPMVLRGTQVRGTDYYSPVLWNPELYAKLKDHVWEDSLADMGTVEVGSLQSVPAPSTSKDK